MAVALEHSNIAGVQPVSMVDWDGKLAAVLFLSGCNFRCPYCHNPELIAADRNNYLSWDQVEIRLRQKKGWLDGVVVSGGEPTRTKGLRGLIERIKEAGLLVKLDTNGSNYEVISDLLNDRLLDYVAMDIKTTWSDYYKVTRVSQSITDLDASARAIVGAGIDHEFRTTVVPGLVGSEEINEIAAYLGTIGARRYFLQQFNPRSVLQESLTTVRPWPDRLVKEMAQACNRFLPTSVRGGI